MSRQDTFEVQVQLAFQQVVEELGEIFSFEEFLASVVSWRQKDIRIEYDQMPQGMTGYSIGLCDCFLVCTLPRLNSIQELVTKLHEIWHIRRGDVPLLSAGTQTPTYQVFIQKRDRHTSVVSRQFMPQTHRFYHMYNTPNERLVETLARRTAHAIIAHETSSHEIAKTVYEW
jgi:hypothetical protein